MIAARWILVGLWGSAWSIAAAQAPATAQIRGQVVSRREAPLAAAEITLLGAGRSVLTDSAGRFVLRDLAPGRHVIQVRRIGFQAQYLAAKVVAGEDKEVAIVLEPGNYELPEIEVTARATKPIEYAWTTKYDDFFRRQRVGLGKYLIRQDVERLSALGATASLLARVPGMKVRFGTPGISPTTVWMTGLPSRGCKIGVWIDGAQQYPNGEDAITVGELIERIHPLHIEMIEVYRGPAEMPAEFLDDSCAAIAIWTR